MSNEQSNDAIKVTPKKKITLDEDSFYNLISSWQCTECSSTNIMSHKGAMYCNSCKSLFVRKGSKDVKPKKRKGRTLDEADKRAELSGGSLYEPVQLTFYCEHCKINALKRLENRNKIASATGVKLTEPTGDEGYTTVSIPNRRLIKDIEGRLEFSCNCGDRRYVDFMVHRRDVKDHPRFACVLGHHLGCMRCRYAWDIYVGQTSFKFRCDVNLCDKIDKSLFIIAAYEEEDEDDVR